MTAASLHESGLGELTVRLMGTGYLAQDPQVSSLAAESAVIDTCK